LLLAEHDGLAAAIIDHSLGDGDSSSLRARFKERGIPVLVYSGFEIEGVPYLSKPATPEQLVAALQSVLLPNASNLIPTGRTNRSAPSEPLVRPSSISLKLLRNASLPGRQAQCRKHNA
jgi:hypothetical protein